MQKTCFLIVFTGAIFLCGCNQQAKLNSQKIDLLSQKIIQLEQSQSQQMTALQSELISLAPELNKMDNAYFEKNHAAEFFFHTNTLYLLLTIGKQIEAQLQVADGEREAQNSLVYGYHTNQLSALYLCTAQIEDEMAGQESRIREAMAGQEKSIVDNINVETRRANQAASDALLKQIKLSATPDAAAAAERAKIEAEVAQIQRDLDMIKARLETTSQPVARP